MIVHVPPLRFGDPVLWETFFGESSPNLHQFLRAVIRQGTNEDGIYQAENDGVGSNAERQCHDRNRGKAGTLCQPAQAVANIMKQSFHSSRSTLHRAFRRSESVFVTPSIHVL